MLTLAGPPLSQFPLLQSSTCWMKETVASSRPSFSYKVWFSQSHEVDRCSLRLCSCFGTSSPVRSGIRGAKRRASTFILCSALSEVLWMDFSYSSRLCGSCSRQAAQPFVLACRGCRDLQAVETLGAGSLHVCANDDTLTSRPISETLRARANTYFKGQFKSLPGMADAWMFLSFC